jgi:hypothetical protein
MNNNLGLTATDFMAQGKINFEGFTNVQRETAIVSEYDFRNSVAGKNLTILTKAQLDELHESAKQAADDSIEKGGDASIQPAAINAHRVVVALEKGGLSEVYLMSKPVEVKGDLLKAEDNDIEKGILDYNNKIEFKKTGKEIKEKLVVVKANIQTKINELATAAGILLGQTEEKPNKPLGDWEYRDYKDKIGEYNLFDWNKCYYKDDTSGFSTGSIDGNFTKEVCDIHSKYNDLIYNIVSLKRDTCECDVFLANLVDTDKYPLSTNELVKLGF